LGVVRLDRRDTVGPDECPVIDDEIPFAQSDQGLMQGGCPGSQDFEALVT
jgi:hypothetical protein